MLGQSRIVRACAMTGIIDETTNRALCSSLAVWAYDLVDYPSHPTAYRCDRCFHMIPSEKVASATRIG